MSMHDLKFPIAFDIDSKTIIEQQLKSVLVAWPELINVLQKGLSRSSYALDEALQIVILKQQQDDAHLLLHLGLFYTGVIAGCSCADDPTPLETEPEYCELRLQIDRITGMADVL